MKLKHFILLLILSALWGASFIFMRILSPQLGATFTAFIRLFVGAILTLLYFLFSGFRINWKRDWKNLWFVGILNSALPMFLFAYAALHLNTGILVMLNSLPTIFAAIIGYFMLKERLNALQVGGIILGFIGIYYISGNIAYESNPNFLPAVLAGITSSLCYGIATNYMKRYASHIPSRSYSGGAQFFAMLTLAPLLIKDPVNVSAITPSVALIALAFGVLCNAIAYMIFYYLLEELGPTKTLTTNFLIPAFGVTWGYLFLNEVVTLRILISMLIIFASTLLITQPRFLFKKKALQTSATQEEA